MKQALPKRLLRFLLVAAFAVAASAQFGGLLNSAKDKINAAKDKAKPITDRAQKASDTFASWTPAEEQAIGDAGAAKMAAIFGVVEDENLNKYVNLVGQTVSQFASRPLNYRFLILNTDEIAGAYAIPGGYIFITKAALAGITSEAQLAGALGHEITHCADRHLEKEIRGKKTSSWAIEEASAKATGDLASLKADAMLKDLFGARLSRDKEDSADELGTLMAAKAGYNANGLVEVLQAMEAASTKSETRRMFGQTLSTHPAFADRVAKLQPVVARAGTNGKVLEARYQATVLAVK